MAVGISCFIFRTNTGEKIQKKSEESWNGKKERGSEGSVPQRERNVNCDLMRVICMLFVIGIHIERSFVKIPLLGVMIETLLFTCNGIFYMLSGRFNLQKDFPDKQAYKNYFISRVITIFCPYLILTFGLSLWDILDAGAWNGIGSYMKETYISLMNANATIHLWFMYPLIGMLLGAPFMAVMLQNMHDWELRLLFGIGIGWNVVSIYLTLDFGVGFSYSGWMLSGWVMLFFLGYYCSRMINDNNKKYLYLWGLAGFIVTVCGKYFIPNQYFNSVDVAAAFVVFTMAFYTFWDREILIKNTYIKRSISFIAKYSFIIYMLHWNVLHKITPRIVKGQASVCNWVISIFTTLIISMLISIVLDFFIISPIQKIMKKVLY